MYDATGRVVGAYFFTGTFRFYSLPSGTLRVRFSGPAIVTEWWKDAATLATATSVVVPPGGGVTNITPMLTPVTGADSTTTVTGTVTYGGNPLAGVTISTKVGIADGHSDDGRRRDVQPVRAARRHLHGRGGDLPRRRSGPLRRQELLATPHRRGRRRDEDRGGLRRPAAPEQLHHRRAAGRQRAEPSPARSSPRPSGRGRRHRTRRPGSGTPTACRSTRPRAPRSR